MKRNIIAAIVCLFIIASSSAAQDKKQPKKDKVDKVNSTVPAQASKDKKNTPGCDTSFWRYVYNPERLDVLEKCKTVTGIIEESNADEDGDQHMLLKLDKGQEEMLTKKNYKKKDGDLVIEAVCVNKADRKKVGNTCNGYVNHIRLPKVGDRVKVTGSYVIDSHNGWAEIHPITMLEVLGK